MQNRDSRVCKILLYILGFNLFWKVWRQWIEYFVDAGCVGQVVTGSWDKTVRCWDARGGTRVGTYPQPERVYSMSLVGHRLVVATAGRHITVYDLRHMPHPEQVRESSLKYQTRCVRCYPNGTGKCLPVCGISIIFFVLIFCSQICTARVLARSLSSGIVRSALY